MPGTVWGAGAMALKQSKADRGTDNAQTRKTDGCFGERQAECGNAGQGLARLGQVAGGCRPVAYVSAGACREQVRPHSIQKSVAGGESHGCRNAKAGIRPVHLEGKKATGRGELAASGQRARAARGRALGH